MEFFSIYSVQNESNDCTFFSVLSVLFDNSSIIITIIVIIHKLIFLIYDFIIIITERVWSKEKGFDLIVFNSSITFVRLGYRYTITLSTNDFYQCINSLALMHCILLAKGMLTEERQNSNKVTQWVRLVLVYSIYI